MQALELAAPGVRVDRRHDQLGVFTTRGFAVGEEILTVNGRAVDGPSRYSIQVGPGVHVEPGDEPGGSPHATRFPWQFLNHACAPTAMLLGRRLLARVALVAGDEVTFDYDSTEWDMAAPFACGCGQPCCRRRIAGYRHLSREARDALAPLVAPHLLASARGERR
ncbi:MAG: hypothetical protein H6835_14420 [Planctomycetes bacterium]|nr:hypothetical protein [Planctomycetota bacterium]